jgi:hypothetical protein
VASHVTAIIISVSREGDTPLGVDIERLALRHWLAAAELMPSKDWPKDLYGQAPTGPGVEGFSYLVQFRPMPFEPSRPADE